MQDIVRQAPYRWTLMGITLPFGLLTTGVLILQMFLLSTIVSRVFLEHAQLVQVQSRLFLLLGLILLHAGLLWGREVTIQHVTLRIKTELRRRLFSHLLSLGPTYSKGERTGELATTLSEGIERLDAYFSRYQPQLLLSVLVPLLITGVIFPLDWTSALLLLFTAPVIPLLMVLVGSYAEAHVQKQWLALSRMSAHFLDVVQGLPTLQLFGRNKAEQQRVAAVSTSFRDKTMKVLRVAFLSGMVLEFMTAFAIALLAVSLGVRLLNQGISFEHAFFILLLAPELFRPLRELGTHRHAAMEGKAAAKRISEILAVSPGRESDTSEQGATVSGGQARSGASSLFKYRSLGTREGSDPCGRPRRDAQCFTEVHSNEREGLVPSPTRSISQLSLTLTDVSYSYPDSQHKALDRLSLTLPARSCIAVVGRSGSGKSTLVHLLLRFLDAQEGEITVNGLPLVELPIDLWREQVAFVPQKPYLFDETLYENIRLARPFASENEVQRAAEQAGMRQFISSLPQGYKTTVGERGTRLSAGQLQRVALARAFLKDAPFLILDEPTSHLDPQSERSIREAVRGLACNRTVLIIAHRLNTVATANQVLVLDDGRLVETGTHAELLGRNGVYSRLMAPSRAKEHVR